MKTSSDQRQGFYAHARLGSEGSAGDEQGDRGLRDRRIESRRGRLGCIGPDDRWYVRWLAGLRLGESQVDAKVIDQLTDYLSKTPQQRKLAFTDVLVKVIPDSRRAPLILFELFPLSVHIVTAMALTDHARAFELRRQQLVHQPAIGDCHSCHGQVLENGEQCQGCGNPLWKHEWLVANNTHWISEVGQLLGTVPFGGIRRGSPMPTGFIQPIEPAADGRSRHPSAVSGASIGEYLIRRLQDYGVRHVFGIPGDYVLSFYAMLEKSPLGLVGCTREDCAGFAADAYARLNGIGAVCVTYCVGGLSLCNSIAGAFAEKSPVVVISGSPGVRERLANPLLHHRVKDFHTQADVFSHYAAPGPN